MTQNESADTDSVDAPIIEQKHGLSIIWLLPLIAAAIGGWLIYKSIVESGITIYITFDSAEGIEEGKTHVIYKGIAAGVVKKISISDDMQTAEVMVEMDRKMKGGLTDKTQFWLVKPEVSITGISGLETLVSGNYIGINPNRDGEKERRFVALKRPPPLDEFAPGLHITLTAAKRGSLDRGSPVYFRQVNVGEVQDYSLNDDEGGVVFTVHIAEPYAHLVRKNSRFWNASGITVKAGLSGVTVRTESLAAVLAGGIAFDSPDEVAAEAAGSGDRFELYESLDSANVGILVSIRFADGNGLEEGETPVKYNGHTVGEVSRVHIPKDLDGVIANVVFSPDVGHLLKEGTRFWLVNPHVSLASGLSSLGSLFKGSHIELKPGTGEPRRSFTALARPPVPNDDAPGLHLVLRAADLGSLQRGSPILFKKITVGTVRDFNLSEDGKSVLLDILIGPQYKHLVRTDSRFWNASGIDVNASLEGVDVRTGTLTSLIGGGIEFISPDMKPQATPARDGTEFTLFDNYDRATDNGALLDNGQGTGLRIEIVTPQLGSLQRGSRVYYKKIPVGEIKGYRLDREHGKVIVSTHIQKEYARLVRKQSRFWNTSGISVEAGLSGINVKTESVSAMLAGGIAFFTPEHPRNTTRARNGERFVLYEDFESATQETTPITIRFASGEGLGKGTPIKYQGQTVGKVRSVQLASDAAGVDVAAVLFGGAKRLARTDSRFWVVGPELGLARTAHLETLIKGPYITLRPGIGARASRFVGLAQAPVLRREHSGLNITLAANQLGSVKQGDPVYYRQVPVGRVIGYELAANATRVLIYANIEPRYGPLVREHSRFWNASGVRVDAGLFSGVQVDTESLEAIIGGGIAFATPDNGGMGRSAGPGQVFVLHDKPEREWLAWSPIIRLGGANRRRLTTLP